MGFFTRPAFVHTTCPACHAIFLVEAQSAGGQCLCPECGEDAVAPPLPKPVGPPVLMGLAAVAVAIAGWSWLVSRPNQDGPGTAGPPAPVEVTYRPSIDLPILDLKEDPKPQPATPIPGLRPEDFAASDRVHYLGPHVTTARVAQLAQTTPAKAEPKKSAEPATEPPKQPAATPNLTDGPQIKELNDAVAAFRRQDLAGAKGLLEEAVKAHPELPPVQFMLGELYLTVNQVGSARQELEQVVVRHPRYAGTYLLFANLALNEGRVTDAALEFDKAKSLEGDLQEPTRKKKIQSAIRAGQVSVGELRKDWPAAQTAAEEWLALEPKSGRARSRLAKALLAQQKPEDALRELNRAFADDAELQPPEAAMAAFYSELGDTENAETWLKKALAAYPKNGRVAMFGAAWYLERERANEAKPIATLAQELDPTAVDAKLMCAVVARHLRNYRDAEKWLELAMRDAPANFSVTNQLALVLAEQEDDLKRKRAMELAEVNARQYPRSADAVSTLGWAYYRGGRTEQAEQALQAAVSGGRATSDTAYYLAHVLAERGKLDAASKLLQEAIKAPGPFTFRAEAKKWLERITARPGSK